MNTDKTSIGNESQASCLVAAITVSASDFERDLYKLINAYFKAGLKKPDVVKTMEYVTQSCRVS